MQTTRTTLQVPVTTNLKQSALAAATDMGFSSLQEAVRLFLKEIANKELIITFDRPTKLSAKNESRYTKMSQDFINKKNITTAHSAEELMEQLHEGD